jgi:hypothetical protein
MTAQGTDSLSTGATYQGVMAGLPFMSFVSLHQDALDRQGPSLLDCVLSWLSGPGNPLVLTPEDWFVKGHQHPNCIWSPAPAAADVALEQMALSVHKRPRHMHLILVPRLMASRRQKYLGKVCTLCFTVPLGSDNWDSSHFEPLIVGLYLPLSRHKPWTLRGTPLLEQVERLLHEMPATYPRWGRVVLHELLLQVKSLEAMPTSMVRTMLYPNGQS